MYPENAPFHKPSVSLKHSDLVNYGFRYKQITLEKIPTSQQVSYVDETELKAMIKGSAQEKEKLYKKVFRKKQAICIEPDQIVLPLNLADRDDIATLLTGIDKVIVERSSEEWLTETQFLIEQEFLKSKNQLIDQLTSLYNETAFNEFLSGLDPERTYHILLAASLASARSAKQACSHVMKTGRLLEDFNQYSFPLFHLGNSIFAFIIFDRKREFLKSFCHALTSRFRTNGHKRLHIGFSGFNAQRHKAQSVPRNTQMVMDEAWTALHKASRRGPFAFCDFELFVNPDIFPMKQINSSMRGKLAYRLKEYDEFSIAIIKPDYKSRQQFDDVVNKYLAKENYIFDDETYVIVRGGKRAPVTRKWMNSLKTKIVKAFGEDYSFSAGISSYPFQDFKKSEIIHNCSKALLHASFYGPGSVVVFDSLSLNVSGDAYFGEGDLATAVREYQKGLELSENDVNLLNSLGVAYSLMNRTQEALQAFERVLAYDSKNFMALYNKGLGELSCDNDLGAIDSFSKALKCTDINDPHEATVLEELEFQLGVCLFRQREYKQAIKILKKWYRLRTNDSVRKRCCRYIGISYYHLQDFKNGSTWLQRALNANESDAEALSLLGEIYLITGEGNDIALKFCEKSVELEPDNSHFRLRYGRVLSGCGHYDKASYVLSQCFSVRSMRAKAWLEAASNCYLKGEKKDGDRYVKKIIDGKNISQRLKTQAKNIFKKSEV